MANSPGLFEEGEPLNVDKLNDLVNATNSNSGNISSITNSTASIQGTLKKGFPVIQAGQLDVSVSTSNTTSKNKYGTKNITITDIAASEFQTIVAVPFSVMGPGETVSVSIGGKYPTFTIYVTASSSWNDSTTKVNYIAAGLRQTS